MFFVLKWFAFGFSVISQAQLTGINRKLLIVWQVFLCSSLEQTVHAEDTQIQVIVSLDQREILRQVFAWIHTGCYGSAAIYFSTGKDPKCCKRFHFPEKTEPEFMIFQVQQPKNDGLKQRAAATE